MATPIISEIELLKILPHGSGIDTTWYFETHKNGNVTAHCSFHLMNDAGYYGWQNFRVRIFRHKSDKLNPLKGLCQGQTQVVHRRGDIDFEVNLTGRRIQRNSTYGLLDDLSENIGSALSEAKILTNRNETIPA